MELKALWRPKYHFVVTDSPKPQMAHFAFISDAPCLEIQDIAICSTDFNILAGLGGAMISMQMTTSDELGGLKYTQTYARGVGAWYRAFVVKISKIPLISHQKRNGELELKNSLLKLTKDS